MAHEGGSGQAGKPSAADARWAAMMIPHHEDGIELTELALQKSRNAGVCAVAAQSRKNQQAQLPGLRKVAAAGGLGPMPPEGPLMTCNKQDMNKLRNLSGAAFDRA